MKIIKKEKEIKIKVLHLNQTSQKKSKNPENPQLFVILVKEYLPLDSVLNSVSVILLQIIVPLLFFQMQIELLN